MHVAHVLETMGESRLEPLDVESLRPHYGRTLWAWSDALEAQLGRSAHADHASSVVRAYRLYLAGSAMSFERAWLSLHQMLAARRTGDPADGPDARRTIGVSLQPRLHVSASAERRCTNSRSKADADLIMMKPVGDQILGIIGKTAAGSGIIEAAALPAAIEALERAIAAERAAHCGGERRADDEFGPAAHRVGLHQRAWPMLEMMKRAAAEQRRHRLGRLNDRGLALRPAGNREETRHEALERQLGQRRAHPGPVRAPASSTAAGNATFSDNISPHLGWSELPAGTKSLALICHDFDVPSKGDDVNQAGREIPADLPRVDFFHWLLCDVPAGVAAIAEGAFSDRFTAHGKPGPAVAVPGFDGAPPRPQRLHRLVRRRSGDGGRLLRLRRPVPALERFARAPLRLHALCARRRPGAGRRPLQRRRRCAGRSARTSSARRRTRAPTRSTGACAANDEPVARLRARPGREPCPGVNRPEPMAGLDGDADRRRSATARPSGTPSRACRASSIPRSASAAAGRPSALAAALAGEGIEAIVASDLARARDTAAAIAAAASACRSRPTPACANAASASSRAPPTPRSTRAGRRARRAGAHHDPDFGARRRRVAARLLRPRRRGRRRASPRRALGRTIAIVTHGGVLDCLYRAAAAHPARRAAHLGARQRGDQPAALHRPRASRSSAGAIPRHLDGAIARRRRRGRRRDRRRRAACTR